MTVKMNKLKLHSRVKKIACPGACRVSRENQFMAMIFLDNGFDHQVERRYMFSQ